MINSINKNGKFVFGGLIILEMANNHQGSVEHGKRIIEEFAPVVARAGVRAVIKFQLRNIDSFIHPDHVNSTDNKHIPRFLSTKLSSQDFRQLTEAARAAGFTTMATPYDESSVDLLNELNIEVIKIASASAADWPLLEKAVQSGKPLVCSTGGLSLEKVDNLVSFLTHRSVHFVLMHCVSIYPTPNHKLNLERIRLFRERYPDIVIGCSSHEDPDNLDVIKVAYAIGARIFERHVGVETDQIKLNSYSSRPEQIARWLDSYNQVISMSGGDHDFTKRQDPEEVESVRLQMRGIYSKSILKQDASIKQSDVFFAIPLQPGQMTSGQWREGLIAERDYQAGEPLPTGLLPLKQTKREIVYKAIHDVNGMLNMARVPVNYDSNVSLHHHQGIDNFASVGGVMIECIANHTYIKKIVVVLPGQSYPKHSHKRVEKAYQMLWGTLEIEIEGRERILQPGDTLIIPRGIWHSFHAPGGAIFEEISTGRSDQDAYYAEQNYNFSNRKQMITQLINWGRYQTDDIEDPVSDSNLSMLNL